MLTDAHVHFGLWRWNYPTKGECYYSPRQVLELLDGCGIDMFAASCTSVQSATADVGCILDEYREMVEIGRGRCKPLLWMTDRAFDADLDLKRWSVDDISWVGLKLHNEESNWVGHDRMERILAIASERNWVVQVHTGGNYSAAGQFGYYCEKFSNVHFCLSHMSPIAEAIDIVSTLDNVWLDCAAVGKDHLRIAANSGLEERILFGSDLPICQNWKGRAAREIVKDNERDVREVFCGDAEKVLSVNFRRFITIQ